MNLDNLAENLEDIIELSRKIDNKVKNIYRVSKLRWANFIESDIDRKSVV